MRTGATQLTQFTPDISITINSITYDNDESTGVLRRFVEDAQLWGGKYTAILDNYDNSLDAVDFTGLQAQVYIGFEEEAGSYLPLLTVEKQQQTSYKGRHAIELTMYDEVAKLALFKGSVGGSVWNHPQQTALALAEVVLPSGEPLPANLITDIVAQSDKTVHQIVDAVVAATSGVTVTDIGSDAYLDSEKPLVAGSDARDVIAQALSVTLSYLRPRTNSTNLDIIKPSGSASCYTYASTEYFFSNVVGLDVLIPNTIIYHGIALDNTTLLTTDTAGGHGINAASVAKVGTISEHRDYDIASRENSRTQAAVDNKADIAISKAALSSNYGILVAPMHCSQELGDAVTIIDESYPTPKTITGYVFRIVREFDKHVYTITLYLGGLETGYTPLSDKQEYSVTKAVKTEQFPVDSISTLPLAVQGFQHDITFSATDYDTVAWSSGTIKFYDGTTQAIAAGNTGNLADTSLRYIYFDLDDAAPTVLKVVTDYHTVMDTRTGLVCLAQKASSTGIKATFLPSSGKTPLLTPDFIDMTGIVAYDYGTDLKIQTIYSSQISAGKIHLSADSSYATGYDPTGKEVSVHRGTTAPTNTNLLWFDTSVGLMKAYSGSAWLVTEGIWYEKTGVVLDATKGISLYGGHVALRTFADNTAYETWLALDDIDNLTGVQCYVGTNGKIYAGAGSVYLDSSGLTVVGQYATFLHSVSSIGSIFQNDIGLILATASTGRDIRLITNSGDISLSASSGEIIVNTGIRPTGTSESFGTSTYYWNTGYIQNIHPASTNAGFIGTVDYYYKDIYSGIFQLVPLVYDPSPIADGMIWYRGTTMYARINGSSIALGTGGFSGNLTDLTINDNKDWNAKGITNLGNLTTTGVIIASAGNKGILSYAAGYVKIDTASYNNDNILLAAGTGTVAITGAAFTFNGAAVSTGASFSGNLSDLTIDANKDWNGKSITNFASLSMNGTISLYDSSILAGAIQANASGMVTIGTQAGYDLYLSSADNMDISADNVVITAFDDISLTPTGVVNITNGKLLSDLNANTKSITAIDSITGTGTFTAGYLKSTTATHFYSGITKVGTITYASSVLMLSAETDIDLSLSVSGTGKIRIGTSQLLGNINANSKKITSLGTPTNSYDAANKSYVDGCISAIPVTGSIKTCGASGSGADRINQTWYTNSSGSPLMLCICGWTANTGYFISIKIGATSGSSVQVGAISASVGYSSCTVIVPIGWVYSWTSVAGTYDTHYGIASWYEQIIG